MKQSKHLGKGLSPIKARAKTNKEGIKEFDSAQISEYKRIVEIYAETTKPLGAILKEDANISRGLFWEMSRINADLKEILYRARDFRTENFVDEMVAISEDDTLSTEDRKIRIYAREKAAMLQNAKTFNPKNSVNIQVNTNEESKLNITIPQEMIGEDGNILLR
jgi:hypothetical protein